VALAFDAFWEGFRESRRCSRDTYPESYITEYTQYTKIRICGFERRRDTLTPGPRRKLASGGRCKATWKSESKLPWREAGPPDHHDPRRDLPSEAAFFVSSSLLLSSLELSDTQSVKLSVSEFSE